MNVCVIYADYYIKIYWTYLELYFALLTLQETNLDIVIADCTTASASLQGRDPKYDLGAT